jgi:hypothetical protein
MLKMEVLLVGSLVMLEAPWMGFPKGHICRVCKLGFIFAELSIGPIYRDDLERFFSLLKRRVRRSA